MELIFKAPSVSVNDYQICRQFEFIDLITWSNFLLELLFNNAFNTMILLLYKCMDFLKVEAFFLCLHNSMSGFLSEILQLTTETVPKSDFGIKKLLQLLHHEP
jgi:hypothetical protein